MRTSSPAAVFLTVLIACGGGTGSVDAGGTGMDGGSDAARIDAEVPCEVDRECNDDNPCTTDLCRRAGFTCVNERLDGVPGPADGDPCTDDLCIDGVASNPNSAAGTECGVGVQCDGAGACVGCLDASECGADTACETFVCNTGTCEVTQPPAGTVLPAAQQTPNDCQALICDGAGAIISMADDSDLPADDGTVCTTEACTAGVPSVTDEALNLACEGGAFCDGGGRCVGCNMASQCPAAPQCSIPTCLGNTCGIGNAALGASCNDGVFCTATDACDGAGNCSGSGNPCLGSGLSTTHVTCAGTTCSFSCIGENYDVDFLRSTGCERADLPLDNHRSARAVFIGNLPCNDGSSTFSRTGRLPSDTRAHVMPPVDQFSMPNGAAPDYFEIRATGGFCVNDFSVSLAVANADSNACFQVTVFTTDYPSGVSCTTNSSGTCNVSRGAGSYNSSSDVFFRVRRICPAGRAATTYTISGHL